MQHDGPCRRSRGGLRAGKLRVSRITRLFSVFPGAAGFAWTEATERPTKGLLYADFCYCFYTEAVRIDGRRCFSDLCLRTVARPGRPAGSGRPDFVCLRHGVDSDGRQRRLGPGPGEFSAGTGRPHIYRHGWPSRDSGGPDLRTHRTELGRELCQHIADRDMVWRRPGFGSRPLRGTVGWPSTAREYAQRKRQRFQAKRFPCGCAARSRRGDHYRLCEPSLCLWRGRIRTGDWPRSGAGAGWLKPSNSAVAAASGLGCFGPVEQ